VGSVYVLLVPPFQAPDEANHFLRAYHVSEGYLFGVKTSDQRFGGYLPESLKTVTDTFRYLRYNYEARISFNTIVTIANLPLQTNQRLFQDFPNVAYYAPLPYLPQALAFALLRPLQVPPLLLMYIGRFVTLLFWTLCVRQAIRHMPFHRWTLTWIALLPASLFLHASLTADAVTNGLCFLLISMLLKTAFTNHTISLQKLIAITLISLIITINKVVYAPLIALSLLIPVQNYKNRTQQIVTISFLFLINALALAWWYTVAGDLFIPYDTYHPVYREGQQLNPGVQPQEQLQYILQYPFTFLKILFISYTESAMATLAHYIGKFGWEKNYLPTWLIGLLALSLPLSALAENTPGIQLKRSHRLFFITITISMILAFSVVIYMQWNPVGNDRIWSLTGRYFIPIFPLFLLALYPNRMVKWLPQDRLVWTGLFGLGYLISMIMVCKRYYLF
jgi:uncharacterized membrane protein